MSNMANIVVKKADGTTDVTYVAMSASPGDKLPAIWQQTAASGIQGNRPWFDFRAAYNARGTFRHINMRGGFPVLYTDINGNILIRETATFDSHFALPMSVSTTDWSEAAAQFGNLQVSALIRACIADGFGPT